MTTAGGTKGQWAALLAAAQAGDGAAYGRFLTEVTPFIRALVRRRVRSGDAVEDVVQDVLLTVHRIRHTYEPGRAVAPWLAAITARRAIDALRRSGRSAARETNDRAAYETFADPAANREGAVGNDAQLLARLMGELPPGQKEALELTKLREMTLAEASAHSGQSVASLKVNVHRAIKRLRLAVARDERE